MKVLIYAIEQDDSTITTPEFEASTDSVVRWLKDSGFIRFAATWRPTWTVGTAGWRRRNRWRIQYQSRNVYEVTDAGRAFVRRMQQREEKR